MSVNKGESDFKAWIGSEEKYSLTGVVFAPHQVRSPNDQIIFAAIFNHPVNIKINISSL